MSEKVVAIVLAAGAGKRMGAKMPKQYIPMKGKPVMAYALEAFEVSAVDGIVLVVAPGEASYCKNEIVDKYHMHKVEAIVEGGNERYDSVYAGLQATQADYVLIHDSARAFVSQEVIARSIASVKEFGACVVGVPSKDTVKIATQETFVAETPKRDLVWSVQTPQCFRLPLIKEAYEKMYAKNVSGLTDDSMVVEQMLGLPVKLVMGDYENIKVTTPDDLLLGEKILEKNYKK